ncbi:putative lipopolysaccharide heptosyltransferase III [Chromobacterium sp. IIBBL 290-4]|uniref:putative lipopolysaccharide heptosyltransferase III n=1 Tax=Chromobacterium sp. IIBBL 290-4 TaxID=2953890 RepID=UPI0020B66502|nr:putative lipopolysaccharide heptosyltransferase III [Chromobacterium sp. IIBBL 290-4]UTH75288.1 putative lipopolysaccharide heptosyltransferase III [Chromobacterium sp. IIBBL 290-4]
MPKDAIDLSQLRRVLVVRLMHHGDVLLSSPVFTVLKNHAPHVEIDALVYHETRDMLTQHPAIDNVFTIDRNWKKLGAWQRLKLEWALFARLKARAYQLIVVLNDNNRATALVRLLKPRWSVVPDVPDRGRFFRKTFTHRHALVLGNKRHIVDWHLDALRRLGIFPSESETKLQMVAGPEAESRVDGLLAAQGLPRGGFILVHPGSRWFYKCWPAERMAALINALHERGWQVALSGAPSDEEARMIAEVKAGVVQPVIDFSGQLSLKELSALIARARMLVGVDSLPMHMAAAAQTPVVALFGPSRDKVWGPWQVPHRQVSLDLPCRPCNLAGCGGSERSECLENIPVRQVLAAVESLLAETGQAYPN